MGGAMSGQRPRPPAPQPGRSVGDGAAAAAQAQSAGGVNEDRHERARRFLERCQVQIWQGESVEEVFAGINKDGDEKLDADEVLAVFRKLHITLDSGARRVYPPRHTAYAMRGGEPVSPPRSDASQSGAWACVWGWHVHWPDAGASGVTRACCTADDDIQAIMRDLGADDDGGLRVAVFSARLRLYRERRRLTDLLSSRLDLPSVIARLVLPSVQTHGDAGQIGVMSQDLTTLRDQLQPLVGEVAGAVAALAPCFQPSQAVPPDQPLTMGRDACGDVERSAQESKFAVSVTHKGGQLFPARFGSQRLFRRGLEALIGLPSFNVLVAMKAEHQSNVKFTAANYKTETSPQLEWEFVTQPRQDVTYPGEKRGTATRGRERKLLQSLRTLAECVRAKLSDEEIIGIRLYTGCAQNISAYAYAYMCMVCADTHRSA